MLSGVCYNVAHTTLDISLSLSHLMLSGVCYNAAHDPLDLGGGVRSSLARSTLRVQLRRLQPVLLQVGAHKPKNVALLSLRRLGWERGKLRSFRRGGGRGAEFRRCGQRGLEDG
eukprot:3016799-Pyramimonas_sp.AAC.1